MDLKSALSVETDSLAVANRAAGILAVLSHQAIGERGEFTLALTGGSSPAQLYDRLGSSDYRTQLDWSRTRVFWGDERAVVPTDPLSNFGQAQNRLLRHVPISPDRVHRMQAERNDLENAASEYQQVLRTFTKPQGALDVILLGVGVDGHIFSLYPGCSEITTPTGLVVALRNPPMDPAVDRLTLTPLALQAARHVLVLVQGENKAAALARLFDPATTETEVPAKLVARAKGTVSILADRAAARLVTHLALA